MSDIIVVHKLHFLFPGVTNIGYGIVTLHDYDEKYYVTFPNGYGRSIMSTPWIELGGKVGFICFLRFFLKKIDG